VVQVEALSILTNRREEMDPIPTLAKPSYNLKITIIE
jgi:hypothetical protein